MARKLELVEAQVSERTRWHFVVLREAGSTAVGVGECSDAGAPAKLVEQLVTVIGQLRGRDVLGERRAIVHELAHRVTTLTGEDAFVAATVLGGLEQLLVDYSARAGGEPVWKWLGGSVIETVPVYANINRMPGGRAPADMAGMASQAVAAGFRAIKCAPFDVPEPGTPLPDTGLARLRAVRDAVGDDVELKVDCHERLTAEQVHRLLPDLANLGIAWLEDVFALWWLDELRELRAATNLPLAGGERMFDPDEAFAAVGENLLDVLMPDVKHAGGIERVLEIARAFPDIAISPHNPSGPVATAASAHLFAACPNATELEYQFGEGLWRLELVGGGESLVDGRLWLSERPGLGVALETGHSRCRVLWSATV